jgi:prophage tail gpP-like protein
VNDATRFHTVAVTIGDQQIQDWTDYEISSSIIEPCDTFQLTRPLSTEAYNLCALDAKVTVSIDGVSVIEGLVDKRTLSMREGTIGISGRDKVGRLIQESIPKSGGYDGLNLVEAVKQLASPWFSKVTLSNARNRSLRRGKGSKAPSGTEPLVIAGKGKSGRLDPGEMRWQVIEDLCAQAGLLCWSAGDGRELILGKPNYQQETQYHFIHSVDGSTCKTLQFDDDISDAYALIEVHGTASGDDAEYGASVRRVGKARDGTASDGTGKLFRLPKRMLLAQQPAKSQAEADRSAVAEMTRRTFRVHTAQVEAAAHGQILGRSSPTLFTPDTIARITSKVAEYKHDALWWIHTVKYRANRSGGETTMIDMVPVGTQVVH